VGINVKDLFCRSQIKALMLAVPLSLVQSGAAVAEEIWPFASLPESFFGMTNGVLQPENTFRFFGGSSQTLPATSGGQTGRQIYFGGFRYRANGPWQFGASGVVFDDAPAAPINGSDETVTYVGWGLDLKYQLYESGRLSAALMLGVEATYYSRGGGLTTQSSVAPDDKEWFLAATLSLPVSYQLSDQFWLTGEIGYTQAPPSLVGATGFGGRAFASTGLAYQVSDRLFAYGTIKLIAREIDNGVDAQDQGGLDYLYTLGGQFALTPQSVINFYVTNAFSPTPTGDDFLFFPAKTEPIFGVMISYFPSGRGVGDTALTFRPVSRDENDRTRFADGFTINAPHTLASDRVHARLAYGSAGQSMLSLIYTPDPDFQFEFSIEDYALATGANFRLESEEDLRYMVGGRWQAMDQDYGDPINLGFRASAGRDFEHPSIGVLFFEATASMAFDWGEAAFNTRGAIYSSETIAGVGMSIRFDLGQTITAIGEYTSVLDDNAVWAVGLRYTPQNLPLSIDLYLTNAVGLNGIGTLLSNDNPQVGISIHWKGGLDLL